MEVHDQGCYFKVICSQDDINNFNDQWPCSQLYKPCSFTFDKRNGDLVDTDCTVDGSEVVALCDDSMVYGIKKLKLKLNQCYEVK